MTGPSGVPLEDQIAQWRGYMRRRRAIDGQDVEEIEGHLRDQMASLTTAGLAGDEAFLVAVKRMGGLDAISREFAREHSERLWKQLIAAEDAAAGARSPAGKETPIVLGLAMAAALAVKVPELFGHHMIGGRDMAFYNRNASLFVLPFLVIYFVWKRGVSAPRGPSSSSSPFRRSLRLRESLDRIPTSTQLLTVCTSRAHTPRCTRRRAERAGACAEVHSSCVRVGTFESVSCRIGWSGARVRPGCSTTVAGGNNRCLPSLVFPRRLEVRHQPAECE